LATDDDRGILDSRCTNLDLRRDLLAAPKR